MNVVLVVFDSLRADHLGAYCDTALPDVGRVRTPNLDEFAQQAIVYDNAYPESLPTLPFRRSLYTGQRTFPYHNHWHQKGENLTSPPGWGPIPEDEDTVAELLSDAGYRTGLVSDLYHTFKPSKNYHRGFDQWEWIRGQEGDKYISGPVVPLSTVHSNMAEQQRGNEWMEGFLQHYLTNVQGRRSEEDYFPAQVFRKASKWLGENTDAEQFFLVVESFDPHEPWDPPEAYRKLYDPDDDVTNVIQSPYCAWQDGLTERELRRIRANYAGEVTLVDRWFGHFMDTLRRSGRWDDTMVILVSDHGHCLGYPGDFGFVGKRGYPMTRAVGQLVTMMRLPDGERSGTRSRALVQNTDMAATILGATGVEPRQELHGRDMRDSIQSGVHREHITAASWGTIVTVIDPEWWYNASIWGDSPLLFRHRTDRLFEHNLAADHPKECERLRSFAVQDAVVFS